MESAEELQSLDLQKIAKEELNEKPERRCQDIEILNKMILDDPDLNARSDDGFLLRFLRARKFNHERSFKLLQNYYRIRQTHPQFYTNFVPSAVIDMLRTDVIKIMPKSDTFGRKVVLVNMGNWNPNIYSHEDLFRGLQICMEKLIEEEQTQICGIVAIGDMSGFSFQHARIMSLSSLKLSVSLIQKCFPLRIKGLHFVHENPIVRFIHRLIQPFLKDKLLKRILFHGWNTESLTKLVAVDTLPKELGGTLSSIDNSAFIQSLTECEDKFVTNNKYGYQLTEESDTNQKTIGSYFKRILHI